MGERTDTVALVSATLEPAFAVDSRSVIVACNAAAGRLLGLDVVRILGQQCHTVIGGRDVFGNRFCSPSCPLMEMAQRREPIRHFDLDIRKAHGGQLRVCLMAMFTPESTDGRHSILHVFLPKEEQAPVGLNEGGTPEARSVIRHPAGVPRTRLTRRELEVVRLLDQGATTSEIAEKCYISGKTVRNHIQNISAKLLAHSRLDAVSKARRLGFL